MNMKGLYKRGRKWKTHYRSNKNIVTSVLYNHCCYFLFLLSPASAKNALAFQDKVAFLFGLIIASLEKKKKKGFKN